MLAKKRTAGMKVQCLQAEFWRHFCQSLVVSHRATKATNCVSLVRVKRVNFLEDKLILTREKLGFTETNILP